MTQPTPASIAVTAAELLFANYCMPGCTDTLMASPSDLWWCNRWAGHEDYGIDHQADDGTTW